MGNEVCLAPPCFERQNISFFSLCSFFAGLLGSMPSVAVCGLLSSLTSVLDPNDPPINCERLWMLDRLRRRSATAFGSRVLDAPEELRCSDPKSRREVLACAVLSMVERLLVSDGTSSADMRRSWGGSPVVQELMVRLSAMEEAEVPRREVSKEPWWRAKSGEEKVEGW